MEMEQWPGEEWNSKGLVQDASSQMRGRMVDDLKVQCRNGHRS